MMSSGNVPYSSYACFDSGYKFMRQTTVAGFAGDFHLALCVLPRGQAHEAWHHGRYAQKDSYALEAGFAGGHASRAVFAEMRGRLFGALCIGTGPGGRVHRDTAPIIRCIL